MRKPVLVSLSLWCWLPLVLGCGEPDRQIDSSVRYEPPVERRIIVETVVDLPFEAAWNELIRRLSESPFRVATLEKASRFASVELTRSSDLANSANLPARYVDCGRTLRTLHQVGFEPERFEYEVAASSHHRESDPVEGGFRLSVVDRRVELAARANLYLQPEGPRRTRISLNARYTLAIEVFGRAVIVPSEADEVPGEEVPFGPRVESIRFSTFQPGHDRRRGGLTCRATGNLEHALIALANPAAAI